MKALAGTPEGLARLVEVEERANRVLGDYVAQHAAVDAPVPSNEAQASSSSALPTSSETQLEERIGLAPDEPRSGDNDPMDDAGDAPPARDEAPYNGAGMDVDLVLVAPNGRLPRRLMPRRLLHLDGIPAVDSPTCSIGVPVVVDGPKSVEDDKFEDHKLEQNSKSEISEKNLGRRFESQGGFTPA